MLLVGLVQLAMVINRAYCHLQRFQVGDTLNVRKVISHLQLDPSLEPIRH